ncbi:rna-directed dna polymerase from mobile element jockey-like [Willisornis vidua]|uniref:Rna-directed dna polymerase from mobile element jockey-like n=1 Tax=Willisornis vidua TaxID=1566151 RepID=A0ABQ9CMI5_9PASS|nr:rna-directed dna polymerase from mobile element jockey-like [Willisornis vidua]
MSQWPSGDQWNVVPQGPVLEPVLFDISVGDMDSGIESTLSKCASDTQLCGVVSMLEGRDAIQRNLDRLERWVSTNLMKSDKDSARSCTWSEAILNLK